MGACCAGACAPDASCVAVPSASYGGGTGWITNTGYWVGGVDYGLRCGALDVFVDNGGCWLDLSSRGETAVAVRLDFGSGFSDPRPEGLRAAAWSSVAPGVPPAAHEPRPTWAAVRFAGAEGTQLALRERDRGLLLEVEAADAAALARWSFAVHGAGAHAAVAGGGLVWRTAAGALRLTVARLCQETGAGERWLGGALVATANGVGLRAGSTPRGSGALRAALALRWDGQAPVAIGLDDATAIVHDVAIDENGCVWIAGAARRLRPPLAPGPYARLKNELDALLYTGGGAGTPPTTLLLGGEGDEVVHGLDIVGDRIVVGGWTASLRLPLAESAAPGAGRDGFVAQLSTTARLRSLVRLAGAGEDVVHGVRARVDGCVAVGATGSAGFAAGSPWPAPHGAGADAFAVAIATGAVEREWRWASDGEDIAYAIDSTDSGQYVVVGTSSSAELGGAPSAGGSDGFIAWLQPDHDAHVVRRFGGRREDSALAVVAADSDAVWVAGWSRSTELPFAVAAAPEWAEVEAIAFRFEGVGGVPMLAARLGDVAALVAEGRARLMAAVIAERQARAAGGGAVEAARLAALGSRRAPAEVGGLEASALRRVRSTSPPGCRGAVSAGARHARAGEAPGLLLSSANAPPWCRGVLGVGRASAKPHLWHGVPVGLDPGTIWSRPVVTDASGRAVVRLPMTTFPPGAEVCAQWLWFGPSEPYPPCPPSGLVASPLIELAPAQ